MSERWFSMGLDGKLYDAGSHPDFEAAEEWCATYAGSVIWIFNEEQAKEMEFILRVGLEDEERQRETSNPSNNCLCPPGRSDGGRGHVHDQVDATDGPN